MYVITKDTESEQLCHRRTLCTWCMKRQYMLAQIFPLCSHVNPGLIFLKDEHEISLTPKRGTTTYSNTENEINIPKTIQISEPMMGASVLTAAALLCTWGRDATWINSNERKKTPLNAVLEIVPIIVPLRKNLSVSTTGILNRDKQVEEILSHVFPVRQLGVSNVSASFPHRLQESVTQYIGRRLSYHAR